MKIALIVSFLVTSLALNAPMLQAIQGKDVHISDSVRGIINYLRENDEVSLKDLTQNEPFVHYDIGSLFEDCIVQLQEIITRLNAITGNQVA